MSDLQSLTNSDLISMGFTECGHIVSNSLKISLGRNRYLVAMCVGQGNEAVFICEKSKVGDHYTDLVCVHNRDYDGFITLEKLKAFIEWFDGDKKEKIILSNMLNMERKKVEDLCRQIDETSQALIDKADRDASSDPYMYETKRAYFQGISEGLNMFRHSVGLSDDLDKEMEGKHAE